MGETQGPQVLPCGSSLQPGAAWDPAWILHEGDLEEPLMQAPEPFSAIWCAAVKVASIESPEVGWEKHRVWAAVPLWDLSSSGTSNKK